MPDWISDHPVHDTERTTPSRDTPRYATGQMYRCLTCDYEHVKNVSPRAPGEETITTHCPECGTHTRHVAIGRHVETYRLHRAERRAAEKW